MTTIGSTATSAAVRRSLERTSPDVVGITFQILLLGALLVSLMTLGVLVVDVWGRAAPVFETRGLDFLTSPLSSDPSKAGISQGLLGTFAIAVLVPLFAFPIGIATAVYLEEYAPDNAATRFFTVNIRNLAGVPSVVYGLLGLSVFVAALAAIDVGNGRNLIAAMLTLGVLVLPIVIITSSEALRSVPVALREAAYGVGASRWEVTAKLVLPAALPGILTGIVLALARALGETAPLILIGGVMGGFSTPDDASVVDRLTGPFTALPLTVYQWSKQPQEEFRALAAAAIIVLLVVTLLANTVAVLLRNRYERSW
ncbi:MAG TPA: phosphate ABC transporter permease PstA [Candidatus Limnocylindrales bacterium]